MHRIQVRSRVLLHEQPDEHSCVRRRHVDDAFVCIGHFNPYQRAKSGGVVVDIPRRSKRVLSPTDKVLASFIAVNNPDLRDIITKPGISISLWASSTTLTHLTEESRTNHRQETPNTAPHQSPAPSKRYHGSRVPAQRESTTYLRSA